MKLLISILVACALIYLPLFLYTQIAVILERINTYGYTLADHEQILEGIPIFRIRIPFEMQIRESFRVRPLLTVMVITCVISLIIFIYAGEYISRRLKSGYDRKSFSRLLHTWQRKRGLCRIQYTATKRFNIYGEKGVVTRHTIRCFLEYIFRPVYILQNRIAQEYNWPRRRWWNLQKARVIITDTEKIEGLVVNNQSK